MSDDNGGLTDLFERLMWAVYEELGDGSDPIPHQAAAMLFGVALSATHPEYAQALWLMLKKWHTTPPPGTFDRFMRAVPVAVEVGP